MMRASAARLQATTPLLFSLGGACSYSSAWRRATPTYNNNNKMLHHHSTHNGGPLISHSTYSLYFSARHCASKTVTTTTTTTTSTAPGKNKPKSIVPVSRVLRTALHHLWPANNWKLRSLVVGSIACVLIAKTARVAVPFWFKSVIDSLVPATAASAAVTVGPVTLGVFGLVVAYSICRITASLTDELKGVLFAPVGAHASTTVSVELFRKIHNLDLTFHLNRQTGALSKDLDRGSRAFWSLSYAIVFMVVPTIFEMGLVCVVLQQQAGGAFMVTAIVAVASYVTWTYVITNYRRKFRDAYNAGDSRVGGLVVDSLLNYETIKYFGRESWEEQRMLKETTQVNHHLKRLDQSMALLNFGQQAIFVAAASTSLYLSTTAVLSGAMTVGDLVLVDALLMQLYLPLSWLGMIYREVQTSTQNMQAMIQLLDEGSSVTEVPDAKPLTYVNGTIHFDDISFAYPGTDRTVLHKLSFVIPGGQTVAFVGPSGSGKSTLFRLLFRMFDPTSGVIRVDGQDIAKTTFRSLRSQFGVIPQDTILFNDTVRYNIRYGKLDATDAEVEAAAVQANLHDTVSKFPDSYGTVVGERGLKLSGGEKQRLAIARVMLHNAPILLADEATSSLDTRTEQGVMNTLKAAVNTVMSSSQDSGEEQQQQRKRTMVIIAHRLSTIKDADLIFVLDGKGGLEESGSHEELLKRRGLYHLLWNQQLHEKQV